MEAINNRTAIPFQRANLRLGERYIKMDKILFPCTPTVDVLTFVSPPNKKVIKVLSKQMARIVLEHDFSYVSKSGHGVQTSEAVATKLVFEHTSVPVPEALMTWFGGDQGSIHMTTVPGTCLEGKWDMLDDESKKSMDGLSQCAADGSPSRDPLLEDLNRPPRPLMSDSELRTRIYEKYLNAGGCVMNMSWGTCPHGVLDWEHAGWHPNYWEYAQTMKPAFYGEFQDWMGRIAPQTWNLTGITASRKVLF
ncbi:hypothetical protein BDW62DRAFT_212266 [Aspergillus aurantiobrunneus]